MVRCWESRPQRRPDAPEVVVVQAFFSTDTHRGTQETGRQGRGAFEIWFFFFVSPPYGLERDPPVGPTSTVQLEVSRWRDR